MEKHTKSDGRTKTVDEAKRAAYSQKKPRYGLRKLSIGLVSCMVGYLCFFSAPVALTAEAAPVSGQGTPVETELGGSIEDTNAQDLTAEEPAAESALPVEGTSAPAVPVTEAAPTPKPLTAPAPAGTQDVPAEAVAAPAPAPAAPAAEAEATQHVTHGVALIGKGAKAAVARVVTSDGDNTTHKELVVGVDGNPADAGSDGVEDLSGIVVTLTGKDGAVVSGTADSWRGTKGFPLVQNFGLHDFAQGEYKVSISLGEGVKHWAVTKSSKLHNGDTVNVDGHLANLEVTLGYDTNGNGVADIDEDNAGRYEPNAVPTTTVKYGEGATTPAITFDDTFTDEKDQLDPQADDSPLKGTTFSIPELGNDAGAQINAATGQITLPEDAQPGTYTYTVTVEYPDMSHDTVDVRVVVTPITDELSAEGGRVVVPESITDGDLADALRGAVTVTGRDGGQVPLDDPRIASVAPKGALPEKTGEKDVEMTVTYSDGSTDTATVHATFVPDVVPVPDPDNPPAVPDGYVRVTFAGGEHGRIRDGATSTFMVNPKADVDLAGSAPAVDADAGWTHSGWDAPLAGRFASEATITATYTQDPKTPENPKDADIYDPKGQDVSTEVGVTPDPSEGIENKGDLPGGTKYTWKEEPKVDAPGESPATVVVTYPDGSTDEVDVVVRVRQSDVTAQTPTEEKAKPKPKESAIPQTGDASALSGAAAASMGFLSLLGGLAARRNRCKEDC
ncbi:MAG: YSIRK-type signal peptide-containing protein [Coriobacteriaceae bacterium]|nr:YSIRK-type signal peptide-containing protein [Coriobacteriaceae bacterium]